MTCHKFNRSLSVLSVLLLFRLVFSLVVQNGTRHHMGILQMMTLFNELAFRIPLLSDISQSFYHKKADCLIIRRILELRHLRSLTNEEVSKF